MEHEQNSLLLLRREARISQAELARRVGCTAARICQLEAGPTLPQSSLVRRAFGVLLAAQREAA